MIVKTKDGSNTIFSKSYNQHYHNVNDGAISEALNKHIIPALEFHKNKKNLKILDICFGLGYNTFATIYYIKKHNLNLKVQFFSPELNKNLLGSLKSFEYPEEFESIMPIIKTFLDKFYYKDENFEINLYTGDAREYIKNLNSIDIIYQDAFSSDVNVELWSVEYFKDLYSKCEKDAIMTTYSIATPVRLSMYEAGFYIYESISNSKKITLAFKSSQKNVGKFVDMERKKLVNTHVKAIYDKKK